MRHVALLRGINVGGKRLAMADLRRIAESLGWRDVATVLATGKLIFTPARRTANTALPRPASSGRCSTS